MAVFVTCFLLVLSTGVFLCHCSGTQIYYIEPAEGLERYPQNSSSCLNITAFWKMADNFTNSSDMVVYFLEGTHRLDLPGLVVFRGLHNAVFEGLGRMEQGFHETVWQSTVVIRCTKSSGIAFANSINITFKSITITNCGARLHFDIAFFYFTPSLVFHHVDNITVNKVSVQNGSGCGLLVITDGFDVTISSSSFARNKVSPNPFINTGNLVLFYPDTPECLPDLPIHKTHITNTNVSFVRYGFQNESVGANLYILIAVSTYEVEIVLDHVIAYHSTGDNIVFNTLQYVLPYTLIINNTQSSHAHGYGIVLYSLPISNYPRCTAIGKPTAISQCVIFRSNFTDNYGYSGGGISFSFEAAEYSLIVTIESTVISNNTALHLLQGGGLQILHDDTSPDYHLNVTLNNVTINNNYQPLAKYKSAVVVSLVTYLKLINVRITNNNSTGLLAYNTEIIVGNDSELVFHNNVGMDGGGLALYQGSYLMFEEGAHLTFTNNKAIDRGGAIFVETVVSSLRIECFFQYALSPFLSASVHFSGNKAGVAGSVLYGGNIDNCELSDSGFLFNLTFNYSDQTGPSVISSDPSYVCFCQNDTPACSLDTLYLSAYPGDEITFSVITLGQRNGVVPGGIQLLSDYNTPLVQEYYNRETKCMNISKVFQYVGKKTIFVTTSGSASPGPIVRKYVYITVLECPPCFNVSNDTQTCQFLYCKELKKSYAPNIACSLSMHQQGNLWIGFENSSHCSVVFGICPVSYCCTSGVHNFTSPDNQCDHNRAGKLCGSCRDGFSLSLGSNNCTNCSDSQFHIALILPFTAAAGFGLVALLMVLNLTVSAGTVNGLIFYANIVNVSESIFFCDGRILLLSLFISWLNLDLGIETCFFSGMTAYAKVWLQFVFPIFIWFIIATIIVLCHYSQWLSIKIGGNVVQVLATLILLSYTKIFRTIVLALKWSTLSYIPSGRTRLVWFEDGNIDYFSWQHFFLLIVALAFLLLAVPYTLALLFDTLIEKYLTKFRKWKVKLKPVIDAYNGPYKDSCRFWTGLLLLARIVLVLVDCFINESDMPVAITTVAVILLSLMAIFGGIYQKKHLDILESWSLLNLAVLSSLVAAQREEHRVIITVSLMFATLIGVLLIGSVYQKRHLDILNCWSLLTLALVSFLVQQQQAAVNISVGLMLGTFIGILLYHLFLRVRDVWCLKKLIDKKQWRKKSVETERLLSSDDDDDAIERVMVAPTTAEVCLRRETLIYSQ